MQRTGELFHRPKPKRRVMMHAIDHGYDGAIVLGRFVCGRCGYDAGWLMSETETEHQRGEPCPNCNRGAIVVVED